MVDQKGEKGKKNRQSPDEYKERWVEKGTYSTSSPRRWGRKRSLISKPQSRQVEGLGTKKKENVGRVMGVGRENVLVFPGEGKRC